MIDIKFEGLQNYCKRIIFDKEESTNLILVNSGKIIRFSFCDNKKKGLYNFEYCFKNQPEYFMINEFQNKCVIANEDEVLNICLVT